MSARPYRPVSTAPVSTTAPTTAPTTARSVGVRAAPAPPNTARTPAKVTMRPISDDNVMLTPTWSRLSLWSGPVRDASGDAWAGGC
eukprot:899937-Rhodomonas_salina.1